MPMLIDDLRAGRAAVSFSPGADANFLPSERATFFTNFGTCLKLGIPVFKVDNVHDYKCETMSTEEVFVEQYPIEIALPMNNFWMEFRDHQDVGVNTGIWVSASQRSAEVWEMGFVVFEQWLDDRSRSTVTLPLYFQINGRGALIDGSFKFPILEGNTMPEEELTTITQATQTAWLALTFLNCKNVVVTESEGKHASRQERRAAERRGDKPLVTYKTLQIEPMKKVLATEGDIATNGLAKALHICRGHFAEYGPEYGKGKLFGKYEGRYYVPAHVRGSAENGVVHKRYNVKAPKESAA